MVIHDLNFEGIALVPHETDPPLVIDADAVPTRSFPAKGFQTVGRRNPEIIQISGVVQHPQFSPSHLLNIVRQACGTLPLPDLLGFFSPEALYHA